MLPVKQNIQEFYHPVKTAAESWFISQHNDRCFGTTCSDFSSKPLLMIAANTGLLGFVSIISSNAHKNPMRWILLLPHFAEKETETQKVKELCPRSHSQQAAKPQFKP